jgi:hypothetical protein
MTFALGRGLEYYDEPSVRAITRAARTKDYRFSSVVLGIVNSTPFRMRSVAQDAKAPQAERRMASGEGPATKQ